MTLAELKIRHELGTAPGGNKLTKGVKEQIRGQLVRQCKIRGCHESLAFTSSRMDRCNAHKRLTEAYTEKHRSKNQALRTRTRKVYMREYRREYYLAKVQNPNAKKIVMKRTLDPGKVGTPNPGTENLIYENYKEPLKAIEKGKGYGYYGTVALSADRQYVQCHVCGNLYAALNSHMRRHNLTSEEYKEMFELNITTALVGEGVRRTMQERVVKLWDGESKLPPWLEEYNRKVQSGEVDHMANRRGKKKPLEEYNKRGTCPDQCLAKIRELANELGHTPSQEEFCRHYHSRFIHPINTHFGSYLGAVKKLGLKSAKELKEPTKEELLLALVDFKDNYGHAPMTSDFKRGLTLYPRQAYWRHFGSLNEAKSEAGLDVAIPMPFGQIVMLTADEYIDYKAGRPIGKFAGKKTKAQKATTSGKYKKSTVGLPRAVSPAAY